MRSISGWEIDFAPRRLLDLPLKSLRFGRRAGNRQSGLEDCEWDGRRASGRCEYCLYPEARSTFAHQVDHVVSRKHGGTSALDSLALCCIFCNRYKGSDVAAIDARTREVVRLFHPRLDRWSNHFRIFGGIIEPITPEAAVTAPSTHRPSGGARQLLTSIP